MILNIFKILHVNLENQVKKFKVQRYFLDIREEENKTKILNIPKGVEINLEKNKSHHCKIK